jgi:hypothetical protein
VKKCPGQLACLANLLINYIIYKQINTDNVIYIYNINTNQYLLLSIYLISADQSINQISTYPEIIDRYAYKLYSKTTAVPASGWL